MVLQKSSNFNKHIKEVNKVEQLFTVLPIYNAFDLYAIEKFNLQKKGLLIPDFDLSIGATALTNKFILVSNNTKHLERISNIKLENWTKDNLK